MFISLWIQMCAREVYLQMHCKVTKSRNPLIELCRVLSTFIELLRPEAAKIWFSAKKCVNLHCKSNMFNSLKIFLVYVQPSQCSCHIFQPYCSGSALFSRSPAPLRLGQVPQMASHKSPPVAASCLQIPLLHPRASRLNIHRVRRTLNNRHLISNNTISPF